MATVINTEFDGTNGAAANLTTEPQFASRTGANGWFYRTTTFASGTSSIDCANDVGLTSIWQYTHAALTGLHYYDICLRLPSLPSAELTVLQLRLGGTNKAQMTVQPDGTIRIKNGTTAVDSTISGMVVAGQWFRVKWGISKDTSSQELRVYNDATPANLFGSAPVDTLTGNYTGGDWDQFRFGVGTAIAVTIGIDRLISDNATWPTSGGSGNTAPTANAGADQDTVTGGTLVTLNGSASSDPDGTIASYSWRQVSGTTVTLSSTTVAGPTFTAPTTAGSAVFGLTVTDNDGASSTEDTVTITWSAAPAGVPGSDFYELFNGSDGVTITTANSDFDVVDTGIVFQAPAIGEGSACAELVANGAVKIMTHILPAGLVSSRYADAVYQISDLSTGPYYIMRALDGTTLRASVRINTNGTIEQRNGLTAVGTPAGQVTAGEPFRVAWHINNGGTMTARLYTGTNIYGTTPSATTTGTMNTGTFDRIGFGIAAPAVVTGTLLVDTVQVEATTWPDPFPIVGSQEESAVHMIVAGVWEPTYLDIL